MMGQKEAQAFNARNNSVMAWVTSLCETVSDPFSLVDRDRDRERQRESGRERAAERERKRMREAERARVCVRARASE